MNRMLTTLGRGALASSFSHNIRNQALLAVNASITRRAALFSTTTAMNNKPTWKLPDLGQVPANSQELFDERHEEWKARPPPPAEKVKKEAEAQEIESQIKGDGGLMSNLLYGTAEAQRDTAMINQSFSKILARGKYVHEIAFHRVKPDCAEKYVQLIGEEYPKRANDKDAGVKLVGSWVTEVGEGDVFVHIWEYNGYTGYHQTMRHLAQQDSTAKFDKELRSMIFTRSNSLAQEFSFWPTTPPRNLGGVFELRSYILHPGKLMEWEQHWRGGLAARQSQGMVGVGAWFSQIGGLNEVHYLWQFGDLRSRQQTRERSWNAEGWKNTVRMTNPLIAKMSSRIMLALPWSPCK